jgi:hypothetical protein
VYCGECGTAGPIFMEAEEGLEGDPRFDDVIEAWIEAGMQRAQRHGHVRHEARVH